MDPEPVQNPLEEPSTVTMERSLSSESGSNSSLSTVHFAKKSGSGSSSRSGGSAASTSRSPHELEVAARLMSWPSPSFRTTHDDQPPDKILSSRADIEGMTGPKDSDKSIVQGSRELQKGSQVQQDDSCCNACSTCCKSCWTAAIADNSCCNSCSTCCKSCWTAAIADNSCCNSCSTCCKSCSTGDIAGDLAAIVCCPFSVIHLLFSCLCCRCPKLIASKTTQNVQSAKSRWRNEPGYREESDLEEAGTTGEGTPRPSTPTKNVSMNPGHSEKKTGGRPTDSSDDHADLMLALSKDPGHDDEHAWHSSSPTLDPLSKEKSSGFEPPRNYFFPSPELDSDNPTSDKPGGR